MSSFKGAALAKRKVTNKTGLDMFVPKFDTSQGAGRETLYHTIVISVLSVFKDTKHVAEDVVQFSVARKYGDFERLQEQLSVEFSAIAFPSLPPRRLYCTDDDLEDRLVAFDSLMKVVAKTKRLSRSRSMLHFLGVGDKLITKFLELVEKPTDDTAKADAACKPQEEEPEVDIFAEEEEETETDKALSEDLDGSAEALFNPVSLPDSLNNQLGHDGVESYLLAAGTDASTDTVFADKRTTDRTKELTDASGELFQMDDQLDSIDHLAKPVKARKPKSSAKAKPKLFDDEAVDGTLTDQQFAALDLQQYIASNSAAASADVDLFS